MREFNVDLVIAKTFTVFAETEEEAKEIAIQRAAHMMDSYNSLEIDSVYEPFCSHVDEDEDLEFENEYEVLCFNEEGKVICEYGIEADHTLGAATAAEEFCNSDYPNEKVTLIRVLIGDTYEDFDVVEGR